MMTCLSLNESTHVLARTVDQINQTLCGLALAAEQTPQGLFAQALKEVTCIRCQSALEPAADPRAPLAPAQDSRLLVHRLLDRINANDAAGMEGLVSGPLLGALSASRMARLHALFPGWRASVDEIIGDESSVVLRYRVGFTDAFGLLGPAGPSSTGQQAIVFRVSNARLDAVCPIVDDFSFWSAPAKAVAGCADCPPPTTLSRGFAYDHSHT
ncbi:MAG: nuclear transport factor 2 family protein [Pseudomonadota bacterium]